MRHPWRGITAGVLALVLLAGCAAQKLHREGLEALDKGQYESGVTLLGEAAARDPHNMNYRIDYEARREGAVQQLIASADRARTARQLDAAAALYRRVLAIDPNNDRAQRGLAGLEGDVRHAEVVEQASKDFDRKDYDTADAKLHTVLNEDPGYGPAEELEAKINLARGQVSVTPRLKTRDNRRVTLQLRDAPTKMVFEVLQRETGINFILDKDVKGDTKTTIFVQDVPVEEAIDLVIDQNGLARQVLADNMVLIYPNIASKEKEYEQQVVRTFYLTNAAPKDVESMLKTVLGAKTLFIDEQANMLVMRDTPDKVRMAEKLVASLDVAQPEVMLEVEVLEISRSRVQDLGLQYPGSATFTPSPLATAAGTLGATTGGLVLSDLAHQNSHTIGVSALSVTLNAMKEAGVVNTLASPKIRVRNREKAKILIGSKEPVITNSVTPTAAGTPVVTGSVQYLDVGLTLDVQPTVSLDNEVAIKLSLEVSSILKQVTTASGTIAYEIGTRNANTLLELKDGETQILGGLIQESDTRNASSIPLLGDIPILSHLFGSTRTDRERDEIVLSITPRIIRQQTRPASDATEFWYGTETRTRSVPFTTSGPGPGAGPQAGASPPAGNAVAPPATSAVQLSVPAAAAGPRTAPGAAAPATATAAAAALQAAAAAQGRPPITAPPAALASNSPPAAGKDGTAASAGSSALTLEGPSEVRVGDEFPVTVRLATDQSITRLRAQVRFEAAGLHIVDAETGDMVPGAADSPKVQTRMGGAQLDVSTTADEPVQGSGILMVLKFKALAPRNPLEVLANLNVLGAAGATIGNSPAPPLKITIQPAGK